MAERISSPATDVTSGRDFNTSSVGSTEPRTGNGNGIVDRVRERATAQLSSQKDRATDGLGSVASAVRQTTQTLREQHHDTVAHYVERAADQIERFSQRLKQKDVTELLGDAQRMARRQPALFVGGAFAIGLVGARFLKSSSPHSYRDDHTYHESPRSESYGSTLQRTPSASTASGTRTASATRDEPPTSYSGGPSGKERF